ncbi:MAG: glycoside hydrolase family 3 C-terminal domain-containing protein, partial [Eubacteriales bacterium]|nr:glycoside hydrolase family 3 C-terminal domain-containing protein [Eubacteriales bacterium]
VWANQHAAAILQAWYPGEQGGHAICDLLFGDANPSGRLPISFPKSVGHIPAFYNHKVSARGYYRKPGTPEKPGRDYVFSNSDPLFSFGFGLSYTTFETCDLEISPTETNPGTPVTVSVTVRNTGSRAGQDVVMLYLTDCYRRITPVVRQLRGFRKVSLQPGEEARIQFTLSDRDLAFVNEQMKWEIEPGEFQVSVGSQNASFWLKGGKILA